MARGVSRSAAGFTIVELLVTVVIVGILSSVAFPMVELTLQRNKEQELRRDLLELREALDAYKKAADQGRIAVAAGESGYPRSLEVLVDGVIDARSPVGDRIYFLRRIPRDPFATDTTTPPSSTWGKRSYASTAENPKEGNDVYDVYSLEPGNGLNDVPYRQW
ncbi:type IV pilin protein [Duganella radicis]|uniref:Prepilin-type N-terminal cleavage/methylation domain-containing protein n=1 Tax=Duganella radicis TaxID=551988 RepID=A0A6L6PPL0_9BURK|nr:type II secretion system protein [Duganella radicis]MTV40561.1 prepilin-type N-terminal cleavage/methylation domain-containing protein [Duganella radicis]